MSGVIDLVIEPRKKDLGGFVVNRALPFANRRMVGPFIFFDHMGPAHFDANSGVDVRPHPHIGLETVTYLFEGRLLHRDSLGTEIIIEPGDVNWMTAGRGIVHSERSPREDRTQKHNLHGLQIWVALPKEKEEMAPAFSHYSSNVLPVVTINGVRHRIIAGEGYGVRSPVLIHSDLFYFASELPAHSEMRIEHTQAERGIYILSGSIQIEDREFQASEMIILKPGHPVNIRSRGNASLVVFGGAAYPESRLIWWNFVASSEALMERAKHEWKSGAFSQVPSEPADEFIPLPET